MTYFNTYKYLCDLKCVEDFFLHFLLLCPHFIVLNEIKQDILFNKKKKIRYYEITQSSNLKQQTYFFSQLYCHL